LKPVAVTLNFAVLPTFTVLFAGWVVIVGGNFTVSFALTLVTLPAMLLTTTEKRLPSSCAVAGGIV